MAFFSVGAAPRPKGGLLRAEYQRAGLHGVQPVAVIRLQSRALAEHGLVFRVAVLVGKQLV